MSPRVTSAQLEYLMDFLEQHPDLAMARFHRGIEGRVESNRQWEQLAFAMNANFVDGAVKDAKGWRAFYSDFKFKLMKKIKLHKEPKFDGSLTGQKKTFELSPCENRLYNMIMRELGEAGAQNSHNESWPQYRQCAEEEPDKRCKTAKSANFATVRQRCIELVKCGFPSALIDHEAFQAILKLIPMRESSRKTLTAELVLKVLGGDDGDADDDEDDDDDTDPLQGNDDAECSRDIGLVKIEMADACPCGQSSGAGHELSCPLTHRLRPYFNYFTHISSSEARCVLCQRSLQWSLASELKAHMDSAHPAVRYEDECLQDEDSDFFDDRSRRDSKKDKRTDKREKKKDSEDFTTQEESPARKRPRFDNVLLRNETKIPIEQFQLLDRFGLYVSALLANIPKDKCIKYQHEIVQKLLKEQAAAG